MNKRRPALPISFRLLPMAMSLALLLTACASPVIQEASDLGRMGQHEAAVAHLRQALDGDPSNHSLRVALFKQQDEAINDLVGRALMARAAGQSGEVSALLKRLEAVAPQHPRVAALRLDVERAKRLERTLADAQKDFEGRSYDRAEATLRALLAEDGNNRQARELLGRIDDLRAQQTRQQSTVSLATSQKPVTLEFREAPLKNVFESLSRAAGINFVFDKDVRGDARVTLFLKSITVEEAMRVILGTQQLGSKFLNDNTVLIFPATQQKQRDLLDTVTRTFYLTNADTKQALALIRTVAKTRDIFADERLNMVVVRDTPEVVRMIERLMQGLDLPDPEVMLELEVLQVSSKKLDQIGVSWPDSVNYGVPDAAGAVRLTTPLSQSMTAYVANPFAIASLKSSRSGTNLLANPRIRARNREKAKVLLGEKLPIFTTTSTANVGVSASVNYLDVGLKLEVEPQVQLDNDVTIKLALEVSSVTDKVIGPQGSIAYQVGTRQASTTLRLKDGETQILAGLINDTESRGSAGVPGLHDLPVAGRLFGVTTDSVDKTEVVLLVTPHVVRNVVQPSAAVSLMPSGTEAQPGALPLQLRDGVSMSGIAGPVAGPGSMSAGTSGRSQAGRGNAALSGSAVSVTGPEEVMPGAAFQVMVRNPGEQPLNATLSFDPACIELGGPKGQGGGGSTVSMSVPPRSMQAVMLRAKVGSHGVDTAITLDSAGAEPLSLRLRDPSVQDHEGAEPAPNAEQDEHNGVVPQ